MKLTIAAAVLLSPLMVHAQVNSPAQPQTANALALSSSFAASAQPMLSAADSEAVPDNSAPVRVSTGVVAPKLIHEVPMVQTSISANLFGPRDREATVSMTVNASGKPENLKIVQSAGRGIDSSVLQMVRQCQFQPATVSGQPVAVPMELHVVIEAPTE